MWMTKIDLLCRFFVFSLGTSVKANPMDCYGRFLQQYCPVCIYLGLPVFRPWLIKDIYSGKSGHRGGLLERCLLSKLKQMCLVVITLRNLTTNGGLIRHLHILITLHIGLQSGNWTWSETTSPCFAIHKWLWWGQAYHTWQMLCLKVIIRFLLVRMVYSDLLFYQKSVTLIDQLSMGSARKLICLDL